MESSIEKAVRHSETIDELLVTLPEFDEGDLLIVLNEVLYEVEARDLTIELNDDEDY